MAFVVALRGDLATSRLTDERAALPAELSDRSYAVTKRQIAGGARSAPLSDCKESKMRAIYIPALVAAGHRAGRHVADLGRTRQR